MKYVYAKLSDKDLLFIRIGGPGLGNLLMIYAKALCIAEKNHAKLIWPTWPQIKIGPWIRREKDKRFYNDIFSNNLDYVSGIKKILVLLTKKKIMEENLNTWLEEDSVLVVHKYELDFSSFFQFRDEIRKNILKILSQKNASAIKKYDGIVIHVRLGDFAKSDITAISKGKDNISLPIEWYVKVLRMVRKVAQKDVPAYVFSDGSDTELALLTEEKDVQRVCLGSSIADIIGLSQGKLIIASGSTFSMWAIFLGNLPAIYYKGQKRQNLTEGKLEIELDMDSDFSLEEKTELFKLFN